jgi:hypothetical protein
MHVARRLSLLITALTLGAAVLLGVVSSRPAVSANAARSLASATHYFDSTVVLARASRPRGVRGDELAIGFGYLERLRLGLGSPFRLVHEALVDPRLDHTFENRVAWALLGRVRRGDSYVIDPASFEGLGPWTPGGHGATGSAHVAFIEHTIRSASDPRVGELAVRLAYSIESAKGAISSSAVGIAVQAAALVRDRALAEADVRDLLGDANELQRGVMQLVVDRRSARVFRVEQPTLAPLSEALQVEAIDATPALVAALDTLDRTSVPDLGGPRGSLLNEQFASRLEALGAERPTLAPIGVTLGTRARTTMRATNEETLAASHALTLADDDSVRRANSLSLLASAVALRSLAQDQPWFPGDGGPSAADLNAEFGLTDVTFARGIPADWQPYYRRELQTALRDMQRVLPAFTPNGLRVRFGDEVLRDSALAMHEPRTRTLQLSVSTSAGTLAHELSHDLDWQSSRRLFADGTGYSTDRAMREPAGPLATSVRGLAAARMLRPPNGSAPAPNTGTSRPAELFARGADWFVASALAQVGRSNGFLSLAQDALLTGYAAGAPAAVGLSGTQSLLAAIGEMTYVPDSIRAGFEAQWADPHLIDPSLLVRRVAETPIMFRGRWSRVRAVAPLIAATRPVVCVADRSDETRARERLLMMAIDARAQGIAARRARFRPIVAAPGDAERFRDMLQSALLAELSSALPDQGLIPVVPAVFRSSAAICSSMAP